MDFGLDKEQQDIVAAAKEFALGEFQDRAQEFDRNETFDQDIWRKACQLGFVGVFIPEEYEGVGYGFLEHCLISEEFWAVDPGIGQAILSCTFGAELLMLFGTEGQKQTVLPKLVAGEAVMGTAITEPDAGSDPTGAATTAVKDGDSWVINGSKIFATNGNLADYMMIFCLTDADNPSKHHRHSFILVPTEAKGYESNKLYGKMGIRASDTAELSLSDLRVPLENLVGDEGEGFHELMAFFNRTRLHICGQGVGLARGALEESIRHTRGRHQFGASLASFQNTQFKLAEMATWIKASRNLYYEAAWELDRGNIDHALIAMAKWYSAENAVRCVDAAVQMHGGYGYIDEYKVQRLYRDAKILEIYEGSKEMEKTIIAGTLVR